MQSEIPKDGFPLGVYVVGFFDMCGQSNELMPYVDINSVTENNIDKLQCDFTRISNQLYQFRSDIVKYFDAAREAPLVSSAPNNISPEVLATISEYDSQRIKLQGFSDTVVVYMPFAVAPGKGSLSKIGALLMSVVNTMLLSFARGTVVRGAIDATWSIEPYDDEIYGPALLSACKLEAGAKWPRVVLGPGIQWIWDVHQNLRADTPADLMNQTLAKLQAELSFRDTDGSLAVDYLGERMLNLLSDSMEPGVIDAAYVGLAAEYQKRSADETIEKKLRDTMSYFESRIGPLTDERRHNATEFLRSG